MFGYFVEHNIYLSKVLYLKAVCLKLFFHHSLAFNLGEINTFLVQTIRNAKASIHENPSAPEPAKLRGFDQEVNDSGYGSHIQGIFYMGVIEDCKNVLLRVAEGLESAGLSNFSFDMKVWLQ